MASRSIVHLNSAIQIKATQVVEGCQARGVDILIYCTARSPEEQAKTYRKSRTEHEINRKIQELESRGFPFLAEILQYVGPQSGTLGKHATWAGPGESWHQYRDAFDAVPLIDGKCLWSYKRNKAEWDVYGAVIQELGLFWGGSFGDYPHCQSHEAHNPLDVLSPQQVHELLAV